MKPIELSFKQEIFYSFGLITNGNNDSLIKKYLSRKSTHKPLQIYSDTIGKSELHKLELVKANEKLSDEHVEWNNQTDNQGYLIRSVKDNL